jgi:4'-phosphopantetheinyl transferase EntD
VYWDRVLFSAKEAVYKAWYPVTRDWLDFADVAVRFDPPGRFRAGLSRPGPVVNLDGRYAVRRGLVLTIVVLPRRPG